MHLKKDASGKVAPDPATFAQGANPHAGHNHAAPTGHTSPVGADKNDATRELDAAMAAMHKAMMVPYTGDADIDFLRGMIPHHQGAVEMAKIQLKYGKDSQVKRLAREIIRAQEYEINLMNRWAAQLEAKRQGPGADKAWLGGK
jgi:uncharacterized protein (DUF305 family)